MRLEVVLIDLYRIRRGNHETGGTWKMADFPNDVEDIQVVADFLIQNYGYVFDLVIGHSKGSVAGMRWLCTSPQASSVRGFVNVSGRYRMEVRVLSFFLSRVILTGWNSSHLVRKISVWFAEPPIQNSKSLPQIRTNLSNLSSMLKVTTIGK